MPGLNHCGVCEQLINPGPGRQFRRHRGRVSLRMQLCPPAVLHGCIVIKRFEVANEGIYIFESVLVGNISDGFVGMQKIFQGMFHTNFRKVSHGSCTGQLPE